MNEKPFNQEADPTWNREPGIILVPGSNFVREVSKFEQFPTQFTVGTQPGNPYTYRPYPKMLYRAESYRGKVCCMATVPDAYEFKDEREYEHAKQAAERFTQKCQLTVGNEEERSRAFEGGWRESPADAVEFALKRDRDVGVAAAHRNYEDRNMGEIAKREIADAVSEADGHVAEIKRRPGRPRKNPEA